MPVSMICGLQWGDEGKGKITHMLSSEADVVARYAGGPNSGHTIYCGQDKFVFHVVPAGIFKDNCTCLIGPGTVIDPIGLIDELSGVSQKTDYNGRLIISESAHTILEYHRHQDRLEEHSKGQAKLGTTLRGIGPAYSDKVNRIGIKLGLLKHPELLKEYVKINLEKKNKLFSCIYGGDTLTLEQVLDPIMALRDKITPLLGDTTHIVQNAIANGKRILLEGNQGVLLDIDHGTYPYVTSSSCVPASGLASFGIQPKALTDCIGVVKAYQTRVGKGPMPTIQNNETGELIRQRGKEYGSSTGRPRDCGWLDLVALKYAVQVSGCNKIALTLIDVLDVFDEVKLCVAYDTPNGKTENFINNFDALNNAKPVYKTVPGWKQDISNCTTWDSLPQMAKEYVKTIEQVAGVPVWLVSVGPKESQTIRRDV